MMTASPLDLRARKDLMRSFWLVCFIFPPTLLGAVLLIMPGWLVAGWWFFGVFFVGLLFWLRSFWWICDWLYELANMYWPHSLPLGIGRRFFRPKSFNVLQWVTVALQALILDVGATATYAFNAREGAVVTILSGLVVGALFAVALTAVIRGLYNGWHYGEWPRPTLGDFIAAFISSPFV